MGNWKIIVPLTSDETSLVTNPSFETNTTGWTTGGTNTIARDSTESWRGAYSLKCTYSNNTTLASYATAAADIDTSTTYYVTAYVFVPSTWDGGNIRIESSGYTSATDTYTTIYTDGTSTKGIWVKLKTSVAIAADDTGSMILATTSAPTATEFVYLDAFKISAQDAEYFDGDDDFAEWASTEHGSKSTADSRSRAHGTLTDLDDWNACVFDSGGTGIAGVVNQQIVSAQLPGSILQRVNVPARYFYLTTNITGNSVTDPSNLHTNRRSLIDVVNSHAKAGLQPFKLRYEGANSETPIQIDCYYDGGFDAFPGIGTLSSSALRLLAVSPFFYSLGDSSTILSTSTTLAVSGILKFQSGLWDDMNGGVDNTGNTTVYDIVRGGGNSSEDSIFAGGDFDSVNYQTDTQNNLDTFALSGDAWDDSASMDANGIIYALAKGPDGTIYAGGDFTTIGGVSANRIAYWNGSTWAAISNGVNAAVYDIAINPSDGLAYIVGAFTQDGIGGGSYARVLIINAAKTALTEPSGGGADDAVWAIEFEPDGSFYIAGDFSNVDDTTTAAAKVAYWKATAASSGNFYRPLGTGLTTGATVEGRALERLSDGRLLVGGEFQNANGVEVNSIAAWNGTTFEALGTGVAGAVHTIATDKSSGDVWIGGTFTTASGTTLDAGIVIWDGSSWGQPSIDLADEDIQVIYIDNFNVDEAVYIGIRAHDGQDTLRSEALTTVTNNGNVDAYPKIVIKRSGGTTATLKTITNHTTGDTLNFNYAIQDGETLTLDFTPGSKTIASSANGNIIGSALLRNSNFGSFHLTPGDNSIGMFIDETGSPTLTAWITFKDQHWSIDAP